MPTQGQQETRGGPQNGSLRRSARGSHPPGASPALARPEDHLKRWFRIAVTGMGFCAVVGAQTLMAFPGWSKVAIVSVVLLLLLLGVGRLAGVVKFSASRWLVFPAAFFIYSLLRSIPPEGEAWSFDQTFQIISSFLLGLGVSLAIESTMPFRWLAYAQVISSYASVIGGFFSADSATESRYSGLVGNANEFSLQLTLGAVLVWLFPKKSGWVACTLAIIAAFYGVATSGSRNALVLLPVLLFFCGLQVLVELKRHRALVVFGVATAFLAMCLVGALLASTLLEQASHITAVKRLIEYKDSSFDKRSAMIRVGIKLWKESPLLGNGGDAFAKTSGFEVYSHNNYVELLCNLGLIGLVLYYGAHFVLLFQSFWLPLSLRLMCWGGMLIIFASDYGIVSYDRKQTILVLMVMASVAVHHQRTSSARALAGQPRGRWPGNVAADSPATI